MYSLEKARFPAFLNFVINVFRLFKFRPVPHACTLSLWIVILLLLVEVYDVPQQLRCVSSYVVPRALFKLVPLGSLPLYERLWNRPIPSMVGRNTYICQNGSSCAFKVALKMMVLLATARRGRQRDTRIPILEGQTEGCVTYYVSSSFLPNYGYGRAVSKTVGPKCTLYTKTEERKHGTFKCTKLSPGRQLMSRIPH